MAPDYRLIKHKLSAFPMIYIMSWYEKVALLWFFLWKGCLLYIPFRLQVEREGGTTFLYYSCFFEHMIIRDFYHQDVIIMFHNLVIYLPWSTRLTVVYNIRKQHINSTVEWSTTIPAMVITFLRMVTHHFQDGQQNLEFDSSATKLVILIS